ncbi:hypothetical protein HMPREF0972_01606 [Actinomyces sp. oral taxon 848 str. F0332]|nr:hypothetical protein HMPREF0972_01606 [Actinomyces sp. oral taxon 848 str. F0332]
MILTRAHRAKSSIRSGAHMRPAPFFTMTSGEVSQRFRTVVSS